MFSCEFCEIPKNTFFIEHLRLLLLEFVENVDSNSNIISDINKSSSNENTPDKIHTDNIEKENTIQNSASANEKLSSSSSITSENATNK